MYNIKAPVSLGFLILPTLCPPREDMDVMMVQYGPPHVHKTEEAKSRFFSPVGKL